MKRRERPFDRFPTKTASDRRIFVNVLIIVEIDKPERRRLPVNRQHERGQNGKNDEFAVCFEKVVFVRHFFI
jgi:hypothetical protein